MKAVIIPQSSHLTLNPLLCNREISSLPVMGEPILSHIRKILFAHNIDEAEPLNEKNISELQSEADDIVAVECNLLSSSDISSAILYHKNCNSDLTVVLRETKDGSQNGRIVIKDKNKITGISNDDYFPLELKYETEGIYIIKASAFGKLFKSVDKICGEVLIKNALSHRLDIRGYVSDCYSISINSISDYLTCHKDAMNGSLPLKLSAVQVKDGLWLENGASLESGVKLDTPVYISHGAVIERGAHIKSYSFISKNCIIKTNSVVSHSVIGSDCCLAENSSVTGSVLAENITLGRNSCVKDNAVIGSGCRIEPDCNINYGVKIWPNKRILRGASVNDNLVLGCVGTDHLFRYGKICGEVNVDVTPEFMAKLGSAVGTMYHNKKVGISYDSSPVCSMLSSALLSGLISSGARVYIYGEQSLPITRRGVRYHGLSVAMHIGRESADGTLCPEIEFLEHDGSDFSPSNERTLEAIFFNNIFIRSDAKKLQESVRLDGYKLSYIQELLNELKSRHFRKNMEIRTKSETISEILEILLGEIELKTSEDTETEFSLDLGFSGQQFTVFSASGEKLDNYKLFSLIVIVLLKHLGIRRIALPVSAPLQLEDIIYDYGGEIIKCGTSDREFMCTLIENKLFEQFNMCYDGIYTAVTILDCLNYGGQSFEALLAELPSCAHKETEVECPNSRKSKLIELLLDKYNDCETDTTDGIKIYQKDGWVLVIPEKYRHYVRIITEAASTEAADEICSNFSNQIKKLAKPE